LALVDAVTGTGDASPTHRPHTNTHTVRHFIRPAHTHRQADRQTGIDEERTRHSCRCKVARL